MLKKKKKIVLRKFVEECALLVILMLTETAAVGFHYALYSCSVSVCMLATRGIPATYTYI